MCCAKRGAGSAAHKGSSRPQAPWPRPCTHRTAPGAGCGRRAAARAWAPQSGPADSSSAAACVQGQGAGSDREVAQGASRATKPTKGAAGCGKRHMTPSSATHAPEAAALAAAAGIGIDVAGHAAILAQVAEIAAAARAAVLKAALGQRRAGGGKGRLGGPKQSVHWWGGHPTRAQAPTGQQQQQDRMVTRASPAATAAQGVRHRLRQVSAAGRPGGPRGTHLRVGRLTNSAPALGAGGASCRPNRVGAERLRRPGGPGAAPCRPAASHQAAGQQRSLTQRPVGHWPAWGGGAAILVLVRQLIRAGKTQNKCRDARETGGRPPVASMPVAPARHRQLAPPLAQPQVRCSASSSPCIPYSCTWPGLATCGDRYLFPQCQLQGRLQPAPVCATGSARGKTAPGSAQRAQGN